MSGAAGSITGVEVDIVALLASIDARLAALDDPAMDAPLSIDWRPR
jgi:hypothetical protein